MGIFCPGAVAGPYMLWPDWMTGKSFVAESFLWFGQEMHIIMQMVGTLAGAKLRLWCDVEGQIPLNAGFPRAVLGLLAFLAFLASLFRFGAYGLMAQCPLSD